MGTWGTGIFADDLASDVRGDWREALLDGRSPEEATRDLVARYADAADDPDERGRFWVALAAAQSATGRLQPDVRDRALEFIDAGGDVAAFGESDRKLGRQRKQVLAKLAAALRGPQPGPTRPVRSRPQVTPLSVGDVVRVRSTGGRGEGLFLVTDTYAGWPAGSVWPVVVPLAWSGGALPTESEMREVPLLLASPLRVGNREAPGGPRLELYVVSGPTRGPRSVAALGEVVARGIRRSDVPAASRGDRVGGPHLAFTSWQYFAEWVGTDQFRETLEMTASARAPRRRWRLPALPRRPRRS